MKHLFDTCTLLKELSQPIKLLEIMKVVNKNEDSFLVPDIVMDELEITEKLTEEQVQQSRGIFNTLGVGFRSYNNVDTISINSNKKYKQEFDKIRFAHYFHVSQKELVRRVKCGEITRERANKLRNRDRGECACIAIAITEPNEFIIVSEDDGKIIEYPKKNIFEIYKKSDKIKVYKYEAWQDVARIVV
ncbi:hypothetical protein KPL42_15165 [Clostridium gasigenes]|uniref:hypothetical protein n=1 Tax=Clostridium gasigenes TaxID=94869 RepID=UPI001C0B405E|nr:hypothetical protein [Clostridium gasigenes]MBU3089824.1 hypothetical protein [Clostridium gasigenes]